VYGKWSRAAPTTAPATTAAKPQAANAQIPARSRDAVRGHTFAKSIENLPAKDREEAILREISRGNLPDFERKFVTIRVKDGNHVAQYQVIPDYLAVGSDEDFVRMPMTPMTAQKLADLFGCALP